MRIKQVASFCLVSCLIAIVGCSSTTKTSQPAAAGMLNTKCPYSMHDVDGKTSSDFNGQKVGFCCANCKGKFDKADAKAQADLVAKVKN